MLRVVSLYRYTVLTMWQSRVAGLLGACSVATGAAGAHLLVCLVVTIRDI